MEKMEDRLKLLQQFAEAAASIIKEIDKMGTDGIKNIIQ